jgi:hypothetical protein
MVSLASFVSILSTLCVCVINCDTGDVTTLYTGDEYGYKYFWLQMYERDTVVFRVKACSDVHIALIQQRVSSFVCRSLANIPLLKACVHVEGVFGNPKFAL